MGQPGRAELLLKASPVSEGGKIAGVAPGPSRPPDWTSAPMWRRFGHGKREGEPQQSWSKKVLGPQEPLLEEQLGGPKDSVTSDKSQVHLPMYEMSQEERKD